MTSSVSNVLQTLSVAKGQKPASTKAGGAEFGILLNQQTSSGVGTSADGILLQNSTAEQLQQSYEKGQTESNYKDIVKINDSEIKDTMAESCQEPYQELETEVKEMLLDKLEVTEEELLQAMEILGITFGDLLQGKGIADLMLQLTGGENMTELLFNAGFQEIMQEMETLISEFATETGLTPEELEFVLQQLNTKDSQPSQGVEAEVEVMEQTEASSEMTDEWTPDSDEQAVQPLKGEVESEGRTEATAAAEIPKETESDGNQQQMMQKDQSGEMKQKEGEQKPLQLEGVPKESGKTDASQTQQVSYQTVQTSVNAIGKEVAQIVEQTFVDVEDIMNQITEFTKVAVRDTQSSLEMQLNPAHLGKIYLQVVSRDGMITAQLSAQNEAVKQTIESQVAVLRENLNQQGLKVEAVEVTIASHEFEQNLEGNQQRDAETQQENGGQKSRRFITADTLEEMSDLMSEEEILAAKIMLENGNSMDVTA